MLGTQGLIWMLNELDVLLHSIVRKDLGVGAFIGEVLLEFLGQI
jgi:hypothetical protein